MNEKWEEKKKKKKEGKKKKKKEQIFPWLLYSAIAGKESTDSHKKILKKHKEKMIVYKLTSCIVVCYQSPTIQSLHSKMKQMKQTKRLLIQATNMILTAESLFVT